MKQISIIEKIRFKKLTSFLAVALVLLFGLSFATNFLGVPRPAKAEITVSGDTVTIDGSVGENTFLIDNTGRILRPPSPRFRDVSGAELNYRYFSYLFTVTGYSVNSSTNLVLDNRAYVIMEGEQSFKSLTVRNWSTISQPFADRSGNINNKPLYTNNYWGMALTGFLAIPPNTRYWLHSDGVDDGISIQIASTDTVPLLDNSPAWKYVYGEHIGEYNELTWPSKYTSAHDFLADPDPTLRTIMTNSDLADWKYVPIRIKIGEIRDNTRCEINYDKWNATTGVYLNDGFVDRSQFYGVGADTHINLTSGQYLMNFEYYVSISDVGPRQDLTNAIKTSWRSDIDLRTAFDGLNHMYGDYWHESFPNRMRFFWDWDESPLGKSKLNVEGFFPYREASRYTAYQYNTALSIDDSAMWHLRRIPGGLILNVSGDINIERNSSIDLIGTGYPGATAELGGDGSQDDDLGGLLTPNPIDQGFALDGSTNIPGRIRGGSIYWQGSPGGGYSNAIHCSGGTGGGGSHAGRGGYLRAERPERNDCGTYIRANNYGDQFNPVTMGSGGGTGGGSTDMNISGSGGGWLKINSSSLTINNGSINTSGSAGKHVRWHTNAGGAGGTVNITTTTLNLNSAGPVIFAEGSDGWPNYDNEIDWHVGGGGGYIHLEYDSSPQTDVRNALSVAGGDGGNGSDYSAGTESADGEPGIIDLVSCRKSSAGVLKKLIAVSRPGSETFNPYALQVGDIITVEISVGSLTVDRLVTIEDESLKVPGGSHVCVPMNGTEFSSVVPTDFSLSENEVRWVITPDSETETFSYQCRVQ